MVAPNSHFCQICFDEIPVKTAAVTAFCGPACPAVLCQTCLVHHISVALQVGYVGALPRVRCPICLVRVHKSQWVSRIATSTLSVDGKGPLVDSYKTLCDQACTFRSPCCHNSSYVHLPEVIDTPTATPPELLVMLKSQAAALRKKCRQFGRHRITARDLITYISDVFPDKRQLVFENVLVRLMDDERRAALLLAYHALHRVVVTRCCGWRTCFNCKRASPNETQGCECEHEGDEIDEATALVQCRSCRAMLVKVDGCDAVVCLCGFSMDWSDELRYRDELKKGLLPVDPFNTTMFDHWVSWHKQLHCSEPLAQALRTKYMDRVLVPLLRPVLVKRVVRHRLKTTVLSELARVVRERFMARELINQRLVLGAFVTQVMVKWRFSRMVQELKRKGFWALYAETHVHEKQQLVSEENAFLSLFNV